MKKCIPIFISIIITALVMGTAAWFYIEEVEQQEYDRGYTVGYGKGFAEGCDTGLDAGYQYGVSGSYDSSDYLTTDTASYGTVYTTPSGEKYHEVWCQYVSGKNNLTYFSSAEEAMDYGYTPCSVCH